MRPAAALLLAAALAVGACGDDDASPADAASDVEQSGEEARDDVQAPQDADPDRSDAGDRDDQGTGGDTDGAGAVGAAGPAPSAPNDPERLAVENPRLAERLCALDPRTLVADPPQQADGDVLRELIDATRDQFAELQSALLELDGGASAAALVDAVVGGWSEAVQHADAGDGGEAQAALDRANRALGDLHARSDDLLAACGR